MNMETDRQTIYLVFETRSWKMTVMNHGIIDAREWEMKCIVLQCRSAKVSNIRLMNIILQGDARDVS